MGKEVAALTMLVAGMAACHTRTVTRDFVECRSMSQDGYSCNVDNIHAQLQKLYVENTAAYMRKDLTAIMALRTADFHSITPDGRTQDRAAMENYIQGILNGVQKWNSMTFTIDSLYLSTNNDTAHAIVKQYVDRIALRPDNQYHHVQSWVTQRESWVRNNGSWRMWRVDQLRDQRRLVDGKPN